MIGKKMPFVNLHFYKLPAVAHESKRGMSGSCLTPLLGNLKAKSLDCPMSLFYI
jgi:hypothetical protein